MPEWLKDSRTGQPADDRHTADCTRAAGISRLTRLRPVDRHPWPLFDLVIRTSRLELRLPTEAELVELLELAKGGVHDPDEMPFGFAWTDQPSPRLERSFMQYHWSRRAAWKPDAWTLDLGVWADGQLVGTQGMRGENFAVLRRVGTGSWLGRAHQGQGIGKEMRSALLAFAFDHLGAERATSKAFVDNPSSIGVSRSLGYADDGSQWAAPRGAAREQIRFLMTREMWDSRERPPIEVSGLEACRDMFGLA
jgi:RimJ/RimL family protein N-acetyltransferase